MDDYINVLYGDAWLNANPLQEAPGIMTNYTQDLLFSMERLSQNPYPLEQVKPEDLFLSRSRTTWRRRSLALRSKSSTPAEACSSSTVS